MIQPFMPVFVSQQSELDVSFVQQKTATRSLQAADKSVNDKITVNDTEKHRKLTRLCIELSLTP